MPVLTCPHSFLHDSDHGNGCRTAYARPGHSQHQRIELDVFKCAIGTILGRPDKPALVQPSGCQPDADTVMYQDFDTVATLVGKEVGRVGVGCAIALGAMGSAMNLGLLTGCPLRRDFQRPSKLSQPMSCLSSMPCWAAHWAWGRPLARHWAMCWSCSRMRASSWAFMQILFLVEKSPRH